MEKDTERERQEGVSSSHPSFFLNLMISPTHRTLAMGVLQSHMRNPQHERGRLTLTGARSAATTGQFGVMDDATMILAALRADAIVRKYFRRVRRNHPARRRARRVGPRDAMWGAHLRRGEDFLELIPGLGVTLEGILANADVAVGTLLQCRLVSCVNKYDHAGALCDSFPVEASSAHEVYFRVHLAGVVTPYGLHLGTPDDKGWSHPANRRYEGGMGYTVSDLSV